MGDKRNILITGGTGKIGTILVKQMLEDGHRVVFTSTSKEKAASFKEQFPDFQSKLDFCVLKFETENSLEGWGKALSFKIDTVIHNARSLTSLQVQENGFSTSENLIEEFKLAIVFPYLITQHLIAQEHPLRDVIFISSMYGSVAPNKNLYTDFHKQSPIQYGIGKAAQLHIVKELAVRFAERGIRVNAISYGGVYGRVNQEFLQRYKQLCPSGRMLNDNDLYPPIKFLINNDELNITGENIKIDGGWTIW